MWEQTKANWQLMRIASAEIATLKNTRKERHNHKFICALLCEFCWEIKAGCLHQIFSVQYLSFVSFRLKSLTFSKFFAAREAIFVVVIPASAAFFVRAKLCRKEKAFQKHKYWKLGKFIDISEFVLIYCDLISSSEGGIHSELFL